MSKRAPLSPPILKAVADVARDLGVNPEWLYAVIEHESAGTWDPQIKAATSSARGLIQFLDKTAQALGYKDSLDLVTKNPTVEGQLRGPVKKYLSAFGPFGAAQELYLAVFMPAYRKKPPDTAFYSSDPIKKAAFQKANPHISTVADYVNRVEKAAKGMLFRVDVAELKKHAAAGAFIVAGVVLIAAVMAMKFLKKKEIPANVKQAQQATETDA